MTTKNVASKSNDNLNEEILDCINKLQKVNLFAADSLDEQTEFNLLKNSKSSNYKTSNDAKEKICKSFSKYAFKQAKNKFNKIGKKISFEDLLSEANIGIIKAINNFDLSKWGKKNEVGIKIRFSSYAKWWVIESLNNYCLKNSSSINFCTTKEDEKVFYNINKTIQKLKINKSCSDLNTKEISKVAVKLKVKDYNIKKYINSINISNSENDLENYFTENSLNQSKDDQLKIDTRIDLEKLLSNKEYNIFNYYLAGYGLEKIAEEFKSNKESIRQIIISSKSKLNTEKNYI